MKVLMQARANLNTCRGGDTIQILKTKEHLNMLGVDVTLSTNIKEDLRNYDIVHLFNLTRIQETYLQLINAKMQNKPVVLSTIYWPTDELELHGHLPFRRFINHVIGVNNFEKIKILLKYFKGEKEIGLREILKLNYFDIQKQIINKSDWLLPNSSEEMKAIHRKFGVNKENYNVVVNAISPIHTNEINDEEFSEYKDCVLCIGRIEPRKNQLNLVKALYNSPYKLVIIGQAAPNSERYFNLVKKAANKNTVFLNYIPNNKIYSICAYAKVHVLASWYETPGLASLEAGACGCNIVITDRGTTRDYFGEMSFYCEPDNLESISQAVDNAYSAPKNNLLKEYILENFTWDKAALQTLEAYHEVYNKFYQVSELK